MDTLLGVMKDLHRLEVSPREPQELDPELLSSQKPQPVPCLKCHDCQNLMTLLMEERARVQRQDRTMAQLQAQIHQAGFR